MMSKKMAELEEDFRKFKTHTERRFVSLDMSIRAYRLEEDQRHEEEDQRHEERIRSYGDFGCLSPNNMTDFKEDEKVFENTRSVSKEVNDEQGKEEKGVARFLEVCTDEQNNNSGSVLNDVGGIMYGKGDTWADVELKNGLRRNPDISALISIHIFQHVELLADRHEKKVVQRRAWDPKINQAVVLSNTLRTRCF
uniref:Uncharacterized protein n=1 Tax=Tanacetum cinerariifolium TaxID=118510 RepID=A0A6L2MWN0_TANCI|nr:hypothetical protein [Tanacetum cinerariifolium]